MDFYPFNFLKDSTTGWKINLLKSFVHLMNAHVLSRGRKTHPSLGGQLHLYIYIYAMRKVSTRRIKKKMERKQRKRRTRAKRTSFHS